MLVIRLSETVNDGINYQKNLTCKLRNKTIVHAAQRLPPGRNSTGLLSKLSSAPIVKGNNASKLHSIYTIIMNTLEVFEKTCF
jgi:hypothetical protein